MFYKKQTYTLLFIGLVLLSCSAPIGSKQTFLPIKISLVSSIWEKNPTSRFLTPETAAVDITIRSDSAGGPILQESQMAVSLVDPANAEAQGTVYLPSETPLVIIASIKDQNGLVISRAESSLLTLRLSGNEPLKLTLLPLETNPYLIDLAVGSNTLTIPKQESRILSFSAATSGVFIKWAMGAYPDLKLQVRNVLGEKIPFKLLGASP
ncbi:hypothetical protein MASR2M78_14630 [Treponema sp.]